MGKISNLLHVNELVDPREREGGGGGENGEEKEEEDEEEGEETATTGRKGP